MVKAVHPLPPTGDVNASVELDHVPVRGFSVVDAGTVHLDDTDHAAVWGAVR